MKPDLGLAPRLEEVAPNVVAYIQPPGSWMVNNAGIVVGDDVLLIDTTATEARTRALLKDVAHYTSGKPIRTVVNTHHHVDHVFGNWLLAPDTTIISSHACREAMLRMNTTVARANFPTVNFGHFELTPPTITFEDRLTLYVGNILVELISVGPAHSAGDVIVWLPDSRVVFAGDLTFHGSHPFLVSGCLTSYSTALQRVSDLQPLTVVPGHGPVAGPEILPELLAYTEWLVNYASRAHQAGLSPLEAARRAKLGRFASWREQERLVGNLARAYIELNDGEDRQINISTIHSQMVQFAGGELHCFA